MNTLLAILKFTDARRDVILPRGLNHNFLGDTPPIIIIIIIIIMIIKIHLYSAINTNYS